MRITKAYFENFIGIYNGLGKKTLSLDFDKDYTGKPITPNRIIFLSGKNGSGKTTIASLLTPFKETFDDRKDLILDGCRGKKVITIVDGENEYEIFHDYLKTGTAKSYIKKNGEELNPGGLIKSFEDIVEKELGITKDFYKIGRIGSNVANFVDLLPAERKGFISKLMPQLDKYLETFSVVKDKYAALNTNIKYIVSQINKFEDEAVLNQRKVTTSSEIANNDAILENMIANLGGLNTKLDAFGIYDFSQIDQKTKEVNQLFEDVEIMKKNVLDFNSKYNGYNPSSEELAERITNINVDIAKKEVTLEALNDKINAAVSNSNNCKNEIVKATASKANILGGKSVSLLTEQVNTSKNKIDTLTSEILNNPYFAAIIGNETLDSVNIASLAADLNSALTTIKQYLLVIINGFNDLTGIYRGESVSSLIKRDGYFSTELQDAKNELSVLKTSAEDIKSQIIKYETIINQYSDVDIPETCNVPTCVFAAKFKTKAEAAVKINELNEKMILAKNAILDKESQIELLSLLTALQLNIEKLEPIGVPAQLMTSMLFYKGFTADLFSNLNSMTVKDLLDIKDTCENTVPELISNMSEYSREKNSLTINEMNLKMSITAEENIKELDAKLIELNQQKDEADKLTAEYLNEKTTLSQEISNQKLLLEDLKAYLQAKTSYKQKKELATSGLEEVTKLNTALQESLDIQAQIKTVSDEIDKTKFSQESLKKTLAEIDNAILTLNEYRVKKKEFEDSIENITIVKNALEPNKGIPLIFIQSYLEQTKLIVNSLLSAAFDEVFEIAFETDASNFFIRVNTNKGIKNDIKEASQGELALSSLSISLALMEQSLKRYNILLLDEIDGPLDTSNRSNFITILEAQMNRLGIEQVFVISHNNAYDTCAMDLILLANSDVNTDDKAYMQNKQIIYKV